MLVTINGVTVLDDDPNSSDLLTPKENTLIDGESNSVDLDSSGSIAWLLPLILIGLGRKRKS